MRLVESTDSATALAAAHGRLRFTVLPEVETRDDGTTVVVIPAEAGSGITEHPFP
jgi:hypothetical protein